MSPVDDATLAAMDEAARMATPIGRDGVMRHDLWSSPLHPSDVITLIAELRRVRTERDEARALLGCSAWRPVPADLAAEQRAADAAGCELRVAVRGYPATVHLLAFPVQVKAYRHARQKGDQDRIYAVRWQKREPSPPDQPTAAWEPTQ